MKLNACNLLGVTKWDSKPEKISSERSPRSGCRHPEMLQVTNLPRHCTPGRGRYSCGENRRARKSSTILVLCDPVRILICRWTGMVEYIICYSAASYRIPPPPSSSPPPSCNLTDWTRLWTFIYGSVWRKVFANWVSGEISAKEYFRTTGTYCSLGLFQCIFSVL